MATGRIGVTPTLGTRWSKAPAGGTTSLSGLDDNSVSLVYSVGYEQVYRNGVLLSRGNDYTATTGNSITLIDATIAGDIIEVFANQLVPLTDAISKGQFTAKGALLSATAASTPGVLAVGTNGQYLTANSSTSTGLEWSTLSAGGMTLISEQTASAATSLSFSSIAGTYKDLMLVWEGIYHSNTTSDFDIRFNNDSGSNYYGTYFYGNPTAYTASTTSGYGSLAFVLGLSSFGTNNNATSTQYSRQVSGTLRINNYASTTKVKHFEVTYGCYGSSNNPYYVVASGLYYSTSAITSLDIVRLSGTGNFTNATNTSIRLYGVS